MRDGYVGLYVQEIPATPGPCTSPNSRTVAGPTGDPTEPSPARPPPSLWQTRRRTTDRPVPPG